MRDYLFKMLDLLTSAYSRKDHDNVKSSLPIETNIGKLFSVLAWGLDSVQEQAELIKLWDNIDNARGYVLDRYGANFGVKRNEASDAFYRLLIKVKLLSQLSGGDINTVINGAAALFNVPAEKITFTELFPAKIQVEVDVTNLDSETLSMLLEIAAMIKRIVAASVGFLLIATTQAPEIPVSIYTVSALPISIMTTELPMPNPGNFEAYAYTNQGIAGNVTASVLPYLPDVPRYAYLRDGVTGAVFKGYISDNDGINEAMFDK